ncbi:hypothetical protein KA977_09755, partial [Candidatus Dependentiae bacterium]|nr:hypothetical protein [Candidatus Dependentiae bacterium]
RENRHKIDFAQTMSDSQFIMVLEKTIKTIAPKVEPVSAKPVLKEQPSEKSYSKKSKSSKPAKKKSLKSKKKQKVSKKQKKSGKPEVIQNIEPVKPRDLKNILDDSIESRVKTRELNANEIKNSSAVKKSSDENQFDEKIKTLQSKISNLKTQLNTTSSEIDSLKNLKKDNRSGKDETKSVSDDKKTREELRKLELEKIKSIGVE